MARPRKGDEMYSLSVEQLHELSAFLKSNGDRLGGEAVEQVIKDGDRLEVDAGTGVVKILRA